MAAGELPTAHWLSVGPELRKDPVMGRWVIISTERAKRPSDFAAKARADRRPEGTCPFCPGNEHLTPPEITRRPGPAGDSGSWSVRAVPNKFPALTPEGALERRGVGIYDKMSGIGAHEVVIETPDHSLQLADLKPDAVETVLAVFRERAVTLAQDHNTRYVLVFKNHGPSAGASLSHSHSQIIATPVVPVLVEAELDGAARYFGFRSRCIYCDMVKQELGEPGRVIYENDSFVTFAPFAPRFPFETWLVSRDHFSSFSSLTPSRTHDLALALTDILGRMNRCLSSPDYNFLVHTAPTTSGAGCAHEVGAPHELEHYHFHLELMPKLTQIAGFEVGSGFYINPLAPESAAEYLREQT